MRRSACVRAMVVIGCGVALAGCRIRTRYDDGATKACTDEAYSTTSDPDAWKKRCDECCHRRGLDAVEPGSCACGKLGLDAILK